MRCDRGSQKVTYVFWLDWNYKVTLFKFETAGDPRGRCSTLWSATSSGRPVRSEIRVEGSGFRLGFEVGGFRCYRLGVRVSGLYHDPASALDRVSRVLNSEASIVEGKSSEIPSVDLEIGVQYLSLAGVDVFCSVVVCVFG